ncbi:CHAT domain-containing protein [Mesorhizobium sp. M1227]|uniref:CHAT domain-containing protein n=1 Tax=Mesorhizobium sp. M1227 TaxID=2957071 RepID=UPI00333682F4
MKESARQFILGLAFAFWSMPFGTSNGAETAIDCAKLRTTVEAAADNFGPSEQGFDDSLSAYRFLPTGSCRLNSNGDQKVLNCDTDVVDQAAAESQFGRFLDEVISCLGPEWTSNSAGTGSVTQLEDRNTGVTLLFQIATSLLTEPEPRNGYYVWLQVKVGAVPRHQGSGSTEPESVVERRKADIGRLPDSDPQKLEELEKAARDYSESVDDLPVGLWFIREAVILHKKQIRGIVGNHSMSSFDDLQMYRGYFDSDLLLNIKIILRLNNGVLTKEGDIDEVLDLIQWRRRALASESLNRSVDRHELPSEIRNQADILELARIEWRRAASALTQARVQGSADISDLVRRLNVAEASYHAASAQLLASGSAYGDIYSAQSMKLSDIRRALRDNETIAIFIAAQFDGPWVVVVNREFAATMDLTRNSANASGELSKAMRRFQRSFSELSVDFDYADAGFIYDTLFAPFATDLTGSSRLILIPDVSFPAIAYQTLLTSPADKNTDGAQLPWLVRKYAISLALSVQSFVAVRGHPNEARQADNFLGFADPVFERVDPNCPGISLFDEPPNKGSQPADVLCPIPETIDHVTSLSQGLGADPARSILSGQAFTQSVVLQRLRKPTHVIAFATHGLVTDEARRIAGLPEPALLVSPSHQVGASDKDRWLTTDEIETLSIDADIVFLSACNTSADGERGGEAFSGLARAFFQAGARGVVVTNWFIDVSSTAKFLSIMKRYWKEFTFGQFPEILQSTMLDSLKINSDPRAWAVFTFVEG